MPESGDEVVLDALEEFEIADSNVATASESKKASARGRKQWQVQSKRKFSSQPAKLGTKTNACTILGQERPAKEPLSKGRGTNGQEGLQGQRRLLSSALDQGRRCQVPRRHEKPRVAHAPFRTMLWCAATTATGSTSTGRRPTSQTT